MVNVFVALMISHHINQLSVWSHDNQLELGQVKVDEKSNEITALPSLLENLDITGSIISLDVFNTKNKLAELSVSKCADYLTALKGNQSTLNDDGILLCSLKTPLKVIKKTP